MPKQKPTRLTSSQMFDFAFVRLNQAGNEYQQEPIVDIIEPSSPENTVYAVRFTLNDKRIVLTSAASDARRIDGRNAGTSPLPKVLEKIQHLQEECKDEIYLVPLAECQYIFGLTYRQHWTMLMIKNKECYFFDPCSDSISIWPSEMSASSIYSLSPLKEILKEHAIDLKDENTTYLGWQKDKVNCGRFCGAIAGMAATMLFSTHTDPNTVKLILKTHSPALADKLEDEAASCKADRRIIGRQSICTARSHELQKRKLKLKKLMSAGSDSTSNLSLVEAKNKYFFETGDGGLKQFKSDVTRCKNLYLQGNAFQQDSELTAELLAELFACDIENANNIIAAHSQGPAAFMCFVLANGIEREENPSIAIGRPNDDEISINIFKENDKIKLHCNYKQFPLLSTDTRQIVGNIEGPVLVAYQLKQKAGQWGWALKSIETQNDDILKILDGKLLREQHIKDHYCVMPTVQVVRHSPSLSTHVCSSYASNSSMSLATPSASPKNSSSDTDQKEIISSTSTLTDKLMNDGSSTSDEQMEPTTMQRLSLEIQRLAEQNHQLSVTNTEQGQRHAQMIAEIEARLAATKELQDQLAEQNHQLRVTNTEQNQQHAQMSAELEARLAATKEQQDRLAEQNHQLSVTNTEQGQRHTQIIAELETRLAATNERHDRLAEQNRQLGVTNTEQGQRQAQMQEDMQQLTQDHQHSETENAQLRAQNTQHQANLERQTAQAEEQEAATAQLVQENTRLREEVAQLADRIDGEEGAGEELQKQNSQLLADKASLARQVRQYENTNNLLTGENIQLHAEVKQLGTQLRQLEQDANRKLTQQANDLLQLYHTGPQKTPVWKYILSGLGIICGVSAAAVGISMLGGFPIILAVGVGVTGALVALGGLIYTRYAYKQDKNESQAFETQVQTVMLQASSSPAIRPSLLPPSSSAERISVPVSVANVGMFRADQADGMPQQMVDIERVIPAKAGIHSAIGY